MKYLTIFVLSVSAFLSAADYKYQPEPNKAEYYIGKFNSGKDMDALVSWGEMFVDWSAENNWRQSTTTVIMSTYFDDSISESDYVWLNIIPNAKEQYTSLETWLEVGTDMLSTLPVTNERVIDTIQWPISSPANTDSDNGIVRFSDCTMNEGVTARDMFDAYKEFDAKAKSMGDNLGRKMILPFAGAGTVDYDFVYSLYGSSMEDFGFAADNYGENLALTDEAMKMNSMVECGNSRVLTTNRIQRGEL